MSIKALRETMRVIDSRITAAEKKVTAGEDDNAPATLKQLRALRAELHRNGEIESLKAKGELLDHLRSIQHLLTDIIHFDSDAGKDVSPFQKMSSQLINLKQLANAAILEGDGEEDDEDDEDTEEVVIPKSSMEKEDKAERTKKNLKKLAKAVKK